MEFLRQQPRLSFRYGGRELEQAATDTQVTQEGMRLITRYSLGEGVTVTNIALKWEEYGAYEWVTWFENTGQQNSAVFSEICDGDAVFPFERDVRPKSLAWLPTGVMTRIYNPKGSVWTRDEFTCEAARGDSVSLRETCLFPGDCRSYAPSGGRSSQTRAPFFDINREDAGVLLAVGWTGQWQCTVSRDEAVVRIRTGIEGARFYLRPHEKLRTSSVVVMPYADGQRMAHNRWRRMLRERYSLIGQPGREPYAPLSQMIWGGVSSEELIRRIRATAEQQLGYEYVWLDAGWYGDSTKPCPNEFEGDWGNHTGNWVVNPLYHPDGLREVAACIRHSGRKLLLWMEPERAMPDTPVCTQHPEYFLSVPDSPHRLLNLGDSAAWQYVFDLLSGYIETLDVRCYRQDFNIDPLPYWRRYDEENRCGIHEIKHIMGLYRLWDSLLERFPHLLIDNCASGGRRIDIETLRRSVPLWRSDYQCHANSDPETAQTHTIAFNDWIPYSATSSGRSIGDLYRHRSAYGPGMGNSYWYSDEEPFTQSEEQLAWIRKTNEEYKRVRPYFSGDFYPLTEAALDDDGWCAYQLDRPEQKDGVVLIFKREKSPFLTAAFSLGGIAEGDTYVFTDADTGEETVLSAQQLTRDGFVQTIRERRVARLFFYRHGTGD